MILDEPVLYNKLLKLRLAPFKPVHWLYTAEFLLGDKVLSVENVTSLDMQGDYVTKVSDYIFISVQVRRSIYLKLLESNGNKLKLRLTTAANTTEGTNINARTGSVKTFNAFLVTNGNPSVVSQHTGDSGNDSDDLVSLTEVDVHLVETGLTKFKLIEVSGVFNQITPGDLIRGLMGKDFSSYGIDQYPVGMVAPDNKAKRYQLSIPDGIKVIDLPDYIQGKYGVYSTGMGYYLKNGSWYIFPLFDYTRFTTSKKRLTILNVPTSEMVGSDNTYIKDGDDTFVFSTGMSHHMDESERNIVNKGSGVRYAKMDNIVDNHIVRTAGVSGVPTGRNRVEFGLDVREGSLVNNRTPKDRYGSNPWQNASEITAGLGSIMLLPWEASSPDLLYPGMPVKLLYKRDGKVVHVFGTLIGVNTTVSSKQKSKTDNRYVSTSILTVRCSSIDE